MGFLFVLFLEKVLVKGHSAIAASLGKTQKRNIYPYMLTFILSIHSIIAGFALGTEDTIGLSIVTFIALISHKWSAAFALGVSLIKGNIKKTTIKKILFLFSFATPIGIVLGTGLSAILTGKSEEITEGIFDAVAAGTFLYIAIISILNKKFKSGEDRTLKFLFSSMGLGLMAVLAIWL